jgi:hypothetical protein
MNISRQDKVLTGGFWAECPDCGGHRYATSPYTNGRGETFEAWVCDQHADLGDEAILCSADILLDANDEYVTRPDETGRPALFILTYDEIDPEDQN